MEEWKTYRLSDLTVMKNGKKRPSTNGQYPVYGGNGIMDYSNQYNADNTIIVGRVGAYCGNVYYYPDKCWISDNAIAIAPNSLIDIDYLFYLMSTLNLHHQHIGGAQPLMTQDIIGGFEVRIPERSIQKKIVSILLSLDNKIELNKRINDNLEQQAQALFKSWFVDFEPFKGGKFVESELGMIPEGWRILELKSICSLITKGITPQYDESSNQLVIGQKCIRERKIDLSIARKHIPKQINEKWVQYGDVLINSTGIGTLGRPAQVWFQKKNVTVDSHVTIVRTNRQNDKMFIGQYFLGKQILLESYATGSTGQADLSKERLAMTRLVYPTDNVLNDFNKIITNMVLKIVELQTETEYLSSLRNTLLPKLMSGELKTNKTTR